VYPETEVEASLARLGLSRDISNRRTGTGEGVTVVPKVLAEVVLGGASLPQRTTVVAADKSCGELRSEEGDPEATCTLRLSRASLFHRKLGWSRRNGSVVAAAAG